MSTSTKTDAADRHHGGPGPLPSGSWAWCRSRSPPPPETCERLSLVASPGAGQQDR
jgi:hypothetical protein